MTKNAAIPRQSYAWDERRNSSRVFPPTPDDVERGQRAGEILRRSDPALYQWIADGAPNLSEAEHLARFGAPYKKHARR